jgi:hypothetical protein
MKYALERITGILKAGWDTRTRKSIWLRLKQQPHPQQPDASPIPVHRKGEVQ